MSSPLVLWLTLVGALAVATVVLVAATDVSVWLVVAVVAVAALAVLIGMRAAGSR